MKRNSLLNTGGKSWKTRSTSWALLPTYHSFLLIEELYDSDSLIAKSLLKTHISHHFHVSSRPQTILMSSSLSSSLASLINASRFLSRPAPASDEASTDSKMLSQLYFLVIEKYEIDVEDTVSWSWCDDWARFDVSSASINANLLFDKSKVQLVRADQVISFLFLRSFILSKTQISDTKETGHFEERYSLLVTALSHSFLPAGSDGSDRLEWW